MYAALRKSVLIRLWIPITADLTIMEEGTECVTKLKAGEKRPLITSCSPGWINLWRPIILIGAWISRFQRKSPMSMFEFFPRPITPRKKELILPKLSRLPLCHAPRLKHDVQLQEGGFQDTDYVLTTREFIRMIKEAGIDFANIP